MKFPMDLNDVFVWATTCTPDGVGQGINGGFERLTLLGAVLVHQRAAKEQRDTFLLVPIARGDEKIEATQGLRVEPSGHVTVVDIKPLGERT